jgi:hypothetical protein
MISFVTAVRMRGEGRTYRERNWRIIYRELLPIIQEIGGEWIVVESGGQFARADGIRWVDYGPDEFTRPIAKNIGWKTASFDWVCFVDADVVMSPNAWRLALQESRKWDVYSPYYQGYKLTDGQTKNRIRSKVYDWNACLPHGSRPGQWNLSGGISFFCRTALEKVDGWDERFQSHGFEDSAMDYLCTQAGLRCGYGCSFGFHLFHPASAPLPNKANTRRLYESAYLGKTFDQIMAGRRELGAWNFDTASILANEPCESLIAVTTINPNPARLRRQQACVYSWQRTGLQVVCLQRPAEIEYLKQHFNGVELQTFDAQAHRDFIPIHALTQVATYRQTSILLLNSDIEIAQEPTAFLREWCSVQPKELRVGIRWNHPAEKRGAAEMELWGIDAFRISPELASHIPESSFVCGLPVWDYWLPWFANKLGFPVSVSASPSLLHENHAIAWSEGDSNWGKQVAKSEFGVGFPALHEFSVLHLNRYERFAA